MKEKAEMQSKIDALTNVNAEVETLKEEKAQLNAQNEQLHQVWLAPVNQGSYTATGTRMQKPRTQ